MLHFMTENCMLDDTFVIFEEIDSFYQRDSKRAVILFLEKKVLRF